MISATAKLLNNYQKPIMKLFSITIWFFMLEITEGIV